jgi:hypothetical protein
VVYAAYVTMLGWKYIYYKKNTEASVVISKEIVVEVCAE